VIAWAIMRSKHEDTETQEMEKAVASASSGSD